MMIVLRFYLLIVLLTIGGALLVGMVLRDKRWLRFAWQLFKFSVVLLLVVGLAITVGRLVLI
jgi:hypothetical protein